MPALRPPTLVVSTPPVTRPPEPPRDASPIPAAAGAILIGCAITLVVHGYQFGASNHSVYLIDALRKGDPTLLANDWFQTRTLQYHSAFGWLTAALLKAGMLQAAFVAIYGLMVLTLHAAWRAIVRAIGGGEQAYLLSVVLYYLSAGGIGLGTYQYLQDSAVLASNVANVALLAGLAGWIAGRRVWAGATIGLAGLFHLNHAVVACLLWAAAAAFENRADLRRWLDGRFVAASVLVAAGCLLNIVPAAVAKLGHAGTMPLADFVDVYVKLRHPHHYHPPSWPWPIWLAFGFWLPPTLAIALSPRALPPVAPDDQASPAARRRVWFTLGLFLALQLVALVFAGAWYVSETLVQMSLFRFSIVPHLLMVTLAATVLARLRWVARALPALMAFALAVAMLSPFADVARARFGPVVALIALGALPAAVPWLASRRLMLPAGLAAAATVLALWPYATGLTRPFLRPDADYLALCDFAADTANAPLGAVFLVPPHDEDFRLRARRAIVVNWKSVPQLAGELPEWQERLSAALGWPDLRALPRGSYLKAVEAMRARYDAVPADALVAAARRYGARYVVATRDLGDDLRHRLAAPAFGRYLLYDLSR